MLVPMPSAYQKFYYEGRQDQLTAQSESVAGTHAQLSAISKRENNCGNNVGLKKDLCNTCETCCRPEWERTHLGQAMGQEECDACVVQHCRSSTPVPVEAQHCSRLVPNDWSPTGVLSPLVPSGLQCPAVSGSHLESCECEYPDPSGDPCKYRCVCKDSFSLPFQTVCNTKYDATRGRHDADTMQTQRLGVV